MDLFHKRTGRVDNLDVHSGQLLHDRACDAVRPDHYAFAGPRFLRRGDLAHAERREALDHMPVMYDRAKGRHALALPDGFLDQRDRAVNSEAEARCFRQYDLHSCHRPSCKSF